jgi:hypothetical protein
MSVQNIFDETGVISGSFLPAYVSSDVRNPMIAPLNGGGFAMTNVGNITSTGTIQGATVNSTGGITATGTITGAVVKSTQWASFPQVVEGTVITWTAPATFCNLINAPASAGTYLITLNFAFNASGAPSGTPILISTINSEADEEPIASLTEAQLGNGGLTLSLLFVQPTSGNILVQATGGSLGGGRTYTFTSVNSGFIKMT